MDKVSLNVIRLLARTKGRMAAIALIIASGVSVYVGMGTSVATVLYTRDTVIARDHLAEYQVHFWPVSENEVPHLKALPGVTHVEPRMIFKGTIELPGREDRLQAAVHFLPLAGQGPMNRLELVAGRWFRGAEDLESAIVDKAMATYHGYKIGDSLKVTLGQATRVWRIVGIAVSPEYLVATANPEFMIPQKGSLGVVYLPKEKQDDLLGVHLVNNLAIGLDPAVDRASFDEVLRPHFKAIEVERWEPREENFAYAFLGKDMKAIGLFVPAIVAVFLVITLLVSYVIFRRIISDQRQEIGTLMALGHSRASIVRSFLLAGALIGVVAGVVGLVLSVGVTELFNHDYSIGLGLQVVLPHWEPLLMLRGALLAIGCGIVSVALPALELTRLQPIAAVRPPMDVVVRRPGRFASLLGRAAMTRYAIRNVTRHRARFAITVASIAGSIAVALSYRTAVVSVDRTFEDYFATDTWDVVAEYVRPQLLARERFAGIAGIEAIEEYVNGNVKVTGPRGSRVLQAAGLPYPSGLKSHDVVEGRLPSGRRGEVVVYRKLAEELGVHAGDVIQVKGVDDTLSLQIVGVTTFSPEQVYLHRTDAQELLKQQSKVTGALLKVRATERASVASTVRGLPFVGNLYLKDQIVSALQMHSKELFAVISIAIGLALLVACLVIASTLTISVLEREPDYATLRVQGFALKAVKRGILGEVLATGTLGAALAVPLSLLLSRFLNGELGEAFFEVKTVLDPVSAAVVVVLAILFMPLAARPALRRVARIDLAATVRRKAMG